MESPTEFPIGPRDDFFHPAGDDPYFNESSFFQFAVPGRDLGGFLHVYHRPNMRFSSGSVVIWDLTGDTPLDCLHYEGHFPWPTPEGTEMHDFSLPNSLTVECVEPLKTYHFTYDNEGCALDLRWTAFIEPQALAFVAGTDGFGKAHWQQAGQMTGWLRLDGEEIAVSSGSFRDHSWGPRGYSRNPRGTFCYSNNSATDAFAVWAASDLPEADDPVFGHSDPIAMGWLVQDGVTAKISSGQTTVVERGHLARPARVLIDATDALGRDLHVEGRCTNWIKFAMFPFTQQCYTTAEWNFAGNPHEIGGIAEFFPAHQYRRFIRSLGQPQGAHGTASAPS